MSTPSSGSTSTGSDNSADAEAEAVGAAPNDTDASADGDERQKYPRRRLALGALLLLLLGIVGAALIVSREESRRPKPDIPLDAWVPYWSLEASVPEFRTRGRLLREVSPFWFNAVAADQIVIDPNASQELTDEFMTKVRGSRADIVPSIVDKMAAGEMAAILADPVTRRQHIDTIVAFAADGDYDGIDLDYEQFAFSDGRSTWADTRPNWVAFVAELAEDLHDDGRTLTVSIPPVYDAEQTSSSGFWVYDYGAIVEHVDRIRIMAYDFSVGDPGPIAPIDWVETTITGAIEATGSPDKLVLGLPAYGRNWPIAVEGECPESDVPGRTSVSARSIDDLIERRDAQPVWVEETGEWMFEYDLEITDGTTTCIQTRQVHYVDGDGVRLRMDLAREYQLDGASLWALGFDDDAVWEAILSTISDPNATTVPS